MEAEHIWKNDNFQVGCGAQEGAKDLILFVVGKGVLSFLKKRYFGYRNTNVPSMISIFKTKWWYRCPTRRNNNSRQKILQICGIQPHIFSPSSRSLRNFIQSSSSMRLLLTTQSAHSSQSLGFGQHDTSHWKWWLTGRERSWSIKCGPIQNPLYGYMKWAEDVWVHKH